MKRILVLLVLLLMFVSCGRQTVTVPMEVYFQLHGSSAKPVEVALVLGETLRFSIDGVPYTVANTPTAEDPLFMLEPETDDGMESVFLRLGPEEAPETAVLTMLSEENHWVYTSDRKNWKALTDWLGKHG